MADIDFTNADSRMNYLKDNLGNLMNGIDKNYGQVMMDELMRRLETTVSEFNEEVKAMLGQLQGVQTTPKDNILAAKTNFTTPPRTAETQAAVRPEAEQFVKPVNEVEIDDFGGLSEFEKKLQALDN